MRAVTVQLVHRDIIFANLVEVSFHKLDDDRPHNGRLWRQARWPTEDKALGNRLLSMKKKEQDIEILVAVYQNADLVKFVTLPFNAKHLHCSWHFDSQQKETMHFDISGFIDAGTVAALEA